MKPLGRISYEWSGNLAYAIGLLTTDGCLSSDGRHIILTSKDEEQLLNFKRCINVDNKIGKIARGGETDKKYFRIQIGDVLFYRFLKECGLCPNKSKILNEIKIPSEYFFDFLRGHHDGDGSFYSYWDPRWKSSYMFYLTFISASRKHVIWLQKLINYHLKVRGKINQARSIFQLRYAKRESLQILKKMYYTRHVVCLSRKKKKIEKALEVEGHTL